MLPESSGKRRHSAKRRKLDATETTTAQPDGESRSDARMSHVEQVASLPESPPARRPSKVVPIVPPPDAPFRPGAIQLWVVRDAEGKKQLVSEMVPGCRHWRIGDPNVTFCFECKKEGDVMGCKTCKRSYHSACLGEEVPPEDTTTAFYCPTCVERGWNVHPPPEILPLTPASSRETSPAPLSSNARDVAAAEIRQQSEQVTAPQQGNRVRVDLVLPSQDSQRICEGSAPEACTPAPNRMRFVPGFGNDYNQSTTTSSGSLVTARQRREVALDDIREDHLVSSPRPSIITESTFNQTSAASRSSRPKSRYQTMPDEVDQALTVIYRELESAAALKQDIAVLQDRVRAAEQARQILEGRLALERSSGVALAGKEAEIRSLNQQLAELRKSNELLAGENNVLKQRMQDQQTSNQAGLEEMEALKASLRRLLGD
ncbi:uncharacterized protein PV07_00663 [Cladophialophora immunda]|uniref:PHD-type domain-containing protein n=3 Tax=Cladophialophora immunda TaxID=569365 RepID=A0A0D2DDQ7_9EURO|nr:uncharacterized protein PV07_00663 [Cladophialophora immunda]KIW33844.1 hypothetical protein PV07_00663 [Cladophialophora immunda]